MKKIIIFILFILTLNMSYSKAMDSKNFSVSSDELFMVTLSSINSLNYKILEIQSDSGYILFSKGLDEYLVMISEISSTASNMKIQKLKKSSPLTDIQNSVFSEVSNSLYNLPNKVQ